MVPAHVGMSIPRWILIPSRLPNAQHESIGSSISPHFYQVMRTLITFQRTCAHDTTSATHTRPNGGSTMNQHPNGRTSACLYTTFRGDTFSLKLLNTIRPELLLAYPIHCVYAYVYIYEKLHMPLTRMHICVMQVSERWLQHY